MTRLKGKARAKANKKKRLKSKNDYYVKKKKLLSKIRKWDDPILEKASESLSVFDDVSEIIKELKDTLAATDNGLGIAASQIGYLKKIFVIRPDMKSGEMKVFINSNIIEEGEKRSVFNEGCLSYPDFYVSIDRPSEITLSYEDESRKFKKATFKDMVARIIFHEHDHTQGVCLVAEEWKKKDEVEETSSSYEIVESEDLKREKAEKENEVISEDVSQQS